MKLDTLPRSLDTCLTMHKHDKKMLLKKEQKTHHLPFRLQWHQTKMQSKYFFAHTLGDVEFKRVVVEQQSHKHNQQHMKKKLRVAPIEQPTQWSPNIRQQYEE